MLSGRRLDLLDPTPVDVEIEDIAHGLSRVARWNGQTSGHWAYSVAQHSLLVEAIAGQLGLPERWWLAALLHDAAEYVVGDLVTPFKAAVGLDYKELENRIGATIRIRFGLPANLPQSAATVIKRADQTAAWLEANQLAGFSEDETKRYFGKPPTVPQQLTKQYLTPWPPADAKSQFLARFTELGG
jgi:5'-deoxynucleotidase YfbR-like HD superfamily hydrolase